MPGCGQQSGQGQAPIVLQPGADQTQASQASQGQVHGMVKGEEEVVTKPLRSTNLP